MTECSNALLSRLPEQDQNRLGEALRRLLSHGSILGLEPGETELYHWCHGNRDWIEEIAALLDLRLFWEHESRIVQAIPQTRSFLLHLKLDASLVLMTLWYEYDTAVRDRGETPPVRLTVEQLNDSLRAKFEPLRKNMPGETRLREILTLGQRKNLLRLQSHPEFVKSGIDILPTLRRIIPFQDIAAWTAQADRYLASATAVPDEPTDEEEQE